MLKLDRTHQLKKPNCLSLMEATPIGEEAEAHMECLTHDFPVSGASGHRAISLKGLQRQDQTFSVHLQNTILVKPQASQLGIISVLLCIKMNIPKRKVSPANLWNVTDREVPGQYFSISVATLQGCKEKLGKCRYIYCKTHSSDPLSL